MRVAVPAEPQAGERHVSVVPEILPKPTAAGAQLRGGHVLAQAELVLSVRPLAAASIALTEHDFRLQTVRTP